MSESTPATPTLLLRQREVAIALGVSLSTVKRVTATGELPSVVMGGCRRYRRSDVDAYIESLSRTPSAIDEYVSRVVDAATELTPGQRDRLASILRGGGA